MKRLTKLLLAVLPFAFLQPAAAEVRDWEFLGSRTVEFRGDRDSIMVTASEGLFSAIQVRVRGAAVEILDLDVRFGDGESQDVKLKNIFRPGDVSRVIDLSGGRRVIRKVDFTYRTLGRRRGRGIVELYGVRVRGAGRDRDRVQDRIDDRRDDYDGRWTLLGARKVEFRQDRDVIEVGRGEGTFSRIYLRVEENGVDFDRVTVTFGDGERFEARVAERIPAGGRTRVIDLPGGRRVIRRIEFLYSTEGLRNRRARVEVWGL